MRCSYIFFFAVCLHLKLILGSSVIISLKVRDRLLLNLKNIIKAIDKKQ